MSGFLDIKDGKNEVLMGKICGRRLAACPRQSALLRFFLTCALVLRQNAGLNEKRHNLPHFHSPSTFFFFFFFS